MDLSMRADWASWRQAPADPLAMSSDSGGGVDLELADAPPDLFVELLAGELFQALGLGGRSLGDALRSGAASASASRLECARTSPSRPASLTLRRLGSGFGLGPAGLGQPEGFPDGHGPLGEHGFDGFAHDERQAAEEDQEVDDLAQEIHARGNFAAHSPRILFSMVAAISSVCLSRSFLSASFPRRARPWPSRPRRGRGLDLTDEAALVLEGLGLGRIADGLGGRPSLLEAILDALQVALGALRAPSSAAGPWRSGPPSSRMRRMGLKKMRVRTRTRIQTMAKTTNAVDIGFLASTFRKRKDLQKGQTNGAAGSSGSGGGASPRELIRRLSQGEKQRKSYHDAGRTSTKRNRYGYLSPRRDRPSGGERGGTGKERDAESQLVSLLSWRGGFSACFLLLIVARASLRTGRVRTSLGRADRLFALDDPVQSQDSDCQTPEIDKDRVVFFLIERAQPVHRQNDVE